MRLLYYSYQLQTVLYSMLDAGCPDPLTSGFPPTPFNFLHPLHPHRSLVLSIYIFWTVANFKCFIWNEYYLV